MAGRQTFGPRESRSLPACSEGSLGLHPSQTLFGPCEWVLATQRIHFFRGDVYILCLRSPYYMCCYY